MVQRDPVNQGDDHPLCYKCIVDAHNVDVINAFLFDFIISFNVVRNLGAARRRESSRDSEL